MPTVQDPSPTPVDADWPALWSELGVVDQVGLVLVLGLSLLGLWRGLWWQVMRLIGVAGSILLARSLAPPCVALLLSEGPSVDPRLVQGGTWLVLFLAGLGTAALLGRFGRRMLEALQLSLFDRLAGALIGALTGLAAHLALVVVLVHLGPADWVESTFPGTWSEGLLHLSSERLPLVGAAGDDSVLEELLHWEQRGH